MSERWAAIPGCPGYEVSDQGRVRSVDRTLTDVQGRVRFYPGLIFSPVTDSVGYPRVTLGGITKRVHRAVLEAFVGPAPEGHEGCHNNGDRTDNRLVNLRWDTHAENNRDAIRHGTSGMTSRTHCPRGHALVPPNLVKREIGRGRRSCLACERARDTRRHTKWALEADMQRLSDAKYAQLTAGASA